MRMVYDSFDGRFSDGPSRVLDLVLDEHPGVLGTAGAPGLMVGAP